MRTPRTRRGARARRAGGAVLLALLLLLVVVSSAVLLDRLNDAVRTRGAMRATTAEALARAKEALIAYAVTRYETTPGEFGVLPCPDIDQTGAMPEGASHVPCGAKHVSSLGRFPWRALEFPPLRDGHGQCLWYAVAGGYKVNVAPDMRNDDTSGAFRVLTTATATPLTGATPGTRAVAVVFAPGPPVRGATNTDRATPVGYPAGAVAECGGNYDAQAYLDVEAGVANYLLATAADQVDLLTNFARASDVGNDRLVYITREELWDAMRKRSDFAQKMDLLTQRVAQCIAQYPSQNAGAPADKRLPWPALVDLGDYRDPTQYADNDDQDVLSGRVAYILDKSAGDTSHAMDAEPTAATKVLFSTANTYCPISIWTAEVDTLYGHWKDHLFYMLSENFHPDSDPTTQPCASAPPSQRCVQVGGTEYAALVIFSGRTLAALGQSRAAPPPGADPDEKASIANYLEGANATNHPNADGDGTYLASAASATFNDVVYAIREDLSVVRLTP